MCELKKAELERERAAHERTRAALNEQTMLAVELEKEVERCRREHLAEIAALKEKVFWPFLVFTWNR